MSLCATPVSFFFVCLQLSFDSWRLPGSVAAVFLAKVWKYGSLSFSRSKRESQVLMAPQFWHHSDPWKKLFPRRIEMIGNRASKAKVIALSEEIQSKPLPPDLIRWAIGKSWFENIPFLNHERTFKVQASILYYTCFKLVTSTALEAAVFHRHIIKYPSLFKLLHSGSVVTAESPSRSTSCRTSCSSPNE